MFSFTAFSPSSLASGAPFVICTMFGAVPHFFSDSFQDWTVLDCPDWVGLYPSAYYLEHAFGSVEFHNQRRKVFPLAVPSGDVSRLENFYLLSGVSVPASARKLFKPLPTQVKSSPEHIL